MIQTTFIPAINLTNERTINGTDDKAFEVIDSFSKLIIIKKNRASYAKFVFRVFLKCFNLADINAL